MPQTTIILCDACDRDLATTEKQVEYCLKLEAKATINPDGKREWESRPLEPKYFCNTQCLKTWTEKHL